MANEDTGISKSFYGELSLASDDSKVNFSSVVWTTAPVGGIDFPGSSEDSRGYSLEFLEYMTVNTFEHYAENFYFKYSPLLFPDAER
ncbi:hypothetical protein AUC61_06315 [Pseudomonas sp. S25]|uniref:Uncharacterized protein n=1 Tax=Pseudomonas maioricensis TaxID=1766623 RepID=A0ABS9ZEU9_9PSED|nr:hypothetical protein [Pseudomonas sp. S25]